jgi:2-methylfumaryl-CoA isomerase
MYPLLKGLRVVEGAAWVAGPSCALHLSQMGADVIRFDQIGGGPDFNRWPRAPGDGPSLYWEGLNKGKKSIALDLGRPEGRELAARLITAPGQNGGLFVTNYPAEGFLSHARLAAMRPDLVTVRVAGWREGRGAMDYTVAAVTGIPYMTGPPELGEAPVNAALPAWDLITGAYAAFSLLAAERHRRDTGQGQEIRIPLGELALVNMGHLGQVAEVATGGQDRPRFGNALYGAFGRDFVTRDGSRLMIVAVSPKQWRGLVEALSLGAAVAGLEAELGVSFAHDESLRFVHRDRLFPLFEQAFAARDFAELAPRLDDSGATWERYRTLHQTLTEDPRLSTSNPMFAQVSHPSGAYLTPGPAAIVTGAERGDPRPAPRLGQHTDEVLAEVMGLPGHEIARLHDTGLVAGPEQSR